MHPNLKRLQNLQSSTNSAFLKGYGMWNAKPKSKIFYQPHPHCTYPPPLFKLGIQKKGPHTELCLALSVCSDLSPPLRGSSARRSPASPPPDQVHACPRVLSTQVGFNEPADLNILYVTRRWFGPCSPGRWTACCHHHTLTLGGDTVKGDGKLQTGTHCLFSSLPSA